jgi:hypothetical protein
MTTSEIKISNRKDMNRSESLYTESGAPILSLILSHVFPLASTIWLSRIFSPVSLSSMKC